jgi:hypothetical protein
VLLITRNLLVMRRCCNKARPGGQGEGTMVSAIILLLAVLTAGAVVAVFVAALEELNRIDQISEGRSHSG